MNKNKGKGTQLTEVIYVSSQITNT